MPVAALASTGARHGSYRNFRSTCGGLLGVTSLLLLVAACRQPKAVEEAPPTYEFTNAHWYTGSGFEQGTRYSRAGVLLRERPASVDSTIDLQAQYVVPPFGEAHTHRPANLARLGADSEFFLDDGIYYVMNHGSLARYRPAFDTLLNQPGTVDAVFANALLASRQSHGVDLWQRLVRRGSFPDVSEDSLDGDAFLVIERMEDLDRKWEKLMESRPDFVKVMLEFSEEYDQRKDDPNFFGRSGLNPILLPALVSRAHAAGLRVSAHIETGADFRLAVEADVDIIAHLPGYDVPIGDDVLQYRIDPSDAARAAEQGTIVITTTLLSVDRAEDDPDRLSRMLDNHARNLRTLADAGVSLAVGSDQYSRNAVDEIMNLASLGIFDNETLLDLLCRVTPRAIFPQRRIGNLEDGAEASFLVLGGNPLQSLEQIRDIRLRVKEGKLLH